MAIKVKWNNLLNLTELDFSPAPPRELILSNELIQTISWLTAATNHDRRLLRCNLAGALLTGNAWDNLTSVETDDLAPSAATPDSHIATVDNKGVLLSTGTFLCKATFVRVSGGTTEDIYIPPATNYFYGYSVYSVTLNTVPVADGPLTYIGLTFFN